MKKKVLLKIIIVLIIFLFGGFFFLDWSPIFSDLSGIEQTNLMFPRTLKFISLVLVGVIAFCAGKDGLNKEDRIKMSLIFVAIIISDFAMMQKELTLGILLFAISQILIIIRNGKGFWGFVSSGGIIKNKFYLTLLTASILVIDVITIFVFFLITKGDTMFYTMIFYSLFLSVSLWISCASIFIKHFPRINTYIIAIGMTIFYISDIIVGLSIALPPGYHSTLADNTIWILFLPAVLLLSLSAYNFDKKCKKI